MSQIGGSVKRQVDDTAVLAAFIEARVKATGKGSADDRMRYRARFMNLLRSEEGRQRIEEVTGIPGVSEKLTALYGSKRSEFEAARDDYRQNIMIEIESRIGDVGYAVAVGSPSWESFYEFGRLEAALLAQYGLRECRLLVDVGCGSGRLALSLPDSFTGEYLGTDISEPLLNHLSKMRNDPRFRFVHVDGLTIPLADGAADMVSMFSLLTHLRHEDSFLYLRDTRRVLRSGGTVVFSFLDFSQQHHWSVFHSTVAAVETGKLHHINQFMSRDLVTAWAEMLEFDVVKIHDGGDEYITCTEPDGTTRLGSLGQSVAVWRKP